MIYFLFGWENSGVQYLQASGGDRQWKDCRLERRREHKFDIVAHLTERSTILISLSGLHYFLVWRVFTNLEQQIPICCMSEMYDRLS